MIHEIFDFFPFDMASGPDFLAFYLCFAIVGVFGAALLRRTIAARIDRSFVVETEPAVLVPAGPATPYRTRGMPPPPPRRRLAVGWVPKPDEFWAIAYLKGGTRGVANTLISAAMAAGWIAAATDKPGSVTL